MVQFVKKFIFESYSQIVPTDALGLQTTRAIIPKHQYLKSWEWENPFSYKLDLRVNRWL